MTECILDLAETPARLKVNTGRLVVERENEETVFIPLGEVAVIILAHPRIVVTQSVLAGLMTAGGSMVVCNEQHLPCGMMLPVDGHFSQTKRFIKQAAAKIPTNKRLWKQVVQAKISAQSRLLLDLHGDDGGIGGLASRVRSGDPENVEAQAAVRYWPVLFGDPDFRRRRAIEDANRLLNYGYAVLRAMVGRALCGVGLHPSLGMHHHNKYNAYCLADDLMEPYRPLVDRAAAAYVGLYGKDAPLDREAKRMLLEALMDRYEGDDEVRSMFDWIGRAASSLAKVYLGEQEGLDMPELEPLQEG